MIKLNNISKSYKLKDEKIEAVKKVTVEFEKGKFYAIMGHSGSGKSTLIHCIGLLENIDEGEIKFDNKVVSNLKSSESAEYRSKNIGFVFQGFYLSSKLKAFENVMLPMLIDKSIDGDEREKRALVLLEKFGLKKRITHMPGQLSGGEQQRVAIARALANNPQIILADEPTGNLDEKNEMLIFDLLKKLSLEGKCVIVVSHSKNIKKYADVIYEINNNTLNEVKYENK